MSWVRGHMPLVTLVSVLVVGLAVLTTTLLNGGKTTNSPVRTAPAGARAASNPTKGSKWLARSGARLLTALNADLVKVSAAERPGDLAAAGAAGTQLAADAAAALNGPMPPVDAQIYRTALNDLKIAGSDAAAGQFGKEAARLLLAGQVRLMEVTAAADRPLREKTPAIPEPAG